MQLNGVLTINASPDEVLAALERPEVLRFLLPGEVTVSARGPGLFDFTLRKAVGFLELRQGGTILVERGPERAVLTVKAAHRIGGSAEAVLGLGLTGTGVRGCDVAYDATISATGLAGRLLRDRESRLQPYVGEVFQRLRSRIEITPQAQDPARVQSGGQGGR